jgi:hypothetical protein
MHVDKEKIAARQKAYKLANREKIAAQAKAYRLANREKIAAYELANREKIAAQEKAYYENKVASRDFFGLLAVAAAVQRKEEGKT